MSSHGKLNRKEIIVFKAKIPKSSGLMEFKERVKAPGTIEEVSLRFYPGQQLSLKIIPIVLHKGQQREDLVSYAEGTEKYLTGDDDYLRFPVTVSVDYDDYIYVYVENTDATYDYDFFVSVVVDYYGGKNRVVGGIV